MKELVLLAGTRETRMALTKQLQSVFGDRVLITSYSSEESLPLSLSDKLVVYSSYLIHDEVKHIIQPSCHIIVAHRTVNYEYIDFLFEIPSGTSVLYVNDFPESVNDSIQTLNRLGLNHLIYVPYSPGKPIPPNINLAVTPGELELIPQQIETKIDIGVRLIDLHTIHKIIDFLQLDEEISLIVTDKYIRKMIELSQKLSMLKQEADTLNFYLKRVVDGVHEGILAFTPDGTITVFNEALQKITGVSAEFALNKRVNQVFKNSELYSFLLNEQEIDSKPFSVNQTNVMVQRFSIKIDGTIVVTFKDMDETIEMEKAVRRELQKKGFVAKYTFDQIIGSSKIIHQTIEIAKKLAKTDLPILIHGESGTGKELFASAIHAYSYRTKTPFIGINCSALPEDLLESELFGYEDGAFTGARKGGKNGLFEQADNGTLFLDEIGDISMKLQARLLRVLQEMEIRRIGGNKIIPINVRIIAATNRDLPQMIEEGKFREDLYHRLNVLFLSLPPLRERREDIPLLIRQFIQGSHKSEAILTSSALETLMVNEWKGNIRELKNTIHYMLTVSEDLIIHRLHLPTNKLKLDNSLSEEQEEISIHKEKEFKTLLNLIQSLKEQGKSASRKRLSELTQASPNPLTEQQTRHRLNQMAEQGLIKIPKGRTGTELTPKGLTYLEQRDRSLDSQLL